MAIRGVLFDVDGTLILSNDAHTQAWVAALAEAGYPVPFARIRPLMGMGGDQLLPRVVPGLTPDAEPGKTIAQRRAAIFLERYLPILQPAPGARALVEHVQQAGLRMMVASSAKKQELDQLLQQAGVADLLTEATTSDDAAASKPAPDVIGVAVRKVALPPTDVIVLGDTPYDITSAQQAQVATIAVRCGGFADDDLAGAVAIYADPADLLAHYDQSPLAQTH